MDGGPLREPEDLSPRRPGARLAAWCAAAGVILGMAAVICLAFGEISVQQAIAVGLPAALLTTAGLIIASIPDPATGRRPVFQAGFLVGSLLSRWRSVFLQRRNRR